MDEAWVEQWRDDVRAAADDLVGTFAERFGYPPGEHSVSGPGNPDGLHGDLLTFYRVVAEVELPDVGNGYWIHQPGRSGDPTRLSDGRDIVVFGSDGGGALFAYTSGAILRLADGELSRGVYDADCATPIAADLQSFLTSLLRGIPDGVG